MTSFASPYLSLFYFNDPFLCSEPEGLGLGKALCVGLEFQNRKKKPKTVSAAVVRDRRILYYFNRDINGPFRSLLHEVLPLIVCLDPGERGESPCFSLLMETISAHISVRIELTASGGRRGS